MSDVVDLRLHRYPNITDLREAVGLAVAEWVHHQRVTLEVARGLLEVVDGDGNPIDHRLPDIKFNGRLMSIQEALDLAAIVTEPAPALAAVLNINCGYGEQLVSRHATYAEIAAVLSGLIDDDARPREAAS